MPKPIKTAQIAACWRYNGIWGTVKPRCQKLDQLLHCRNCDVFMDAAKERFSSRSNQEVALLTELLSSSQQSQENQQGDAAVLPFRLGTYWFGLPVDLLHAVVDAPPIHSVPHRDNETLKGVGAIHGELVALISLASLLSIDHQGVSSSHREPLHFNRCLLIATGERRIAFTVDQVQGLRRYYHRTLGPIPQDYAIHSELVEGMIGGDDNIDILCLDANRLLDNLEQVLA